MTDQRVNSPRTGATASVAANKASPAVYRRRRLAVFVGLLVIVLALVLVTGFVWPGFWRSEATPQPAPTVTVTAPVPTPTVKAMERAGDETAFQKALPSSVLQFALGSLAEAKEPQGDGALEAWNAEYSDGGSGEVTLLAGQWATSDEAATAAAAWTSSAGEADREGDVKVGKKVVGQYAIVPAKGGKAVVVWQNGTAVMRATGPADTMEDFYAAFPL
ncbi:hypothetical protein [Promicromonospora iranensis]|uniref:Uncharacterized protein n=1 Tax=Promicromonospora iranensis TaxID=1105144 RepID=A0ABU2CN42_9MICO|nr:hypothetical protein [Promicromonospora iranensis]MDR7382761.1 hypothetical protein [Promicromonospora iranensis]